MRANLTKVLCGLALTAALTGPATAGEELVMPFACRVAGGTVALSPSAPQAYQIYGRHERKRLKTCSPYDPGKCHNWAIHRFDLDCGGVRTSWKSVVAALGPMFAESSGAPGNAYDAPAYDSQGPGRPYRLGPGPAITFPPDFAPNPLKIATFKRTEPAVAQVPLPPKKPDQVAPSQVAESQPSGNAKTTSKTASADSKPMKVAEHRALKIEIENGSAEVTGSLPKSDTGALWRDASLVFAVTLAALLFLSAMLVFRRRGMPALPGPLPRLHGPAGPRALARMSSAVLEGAAAAAPKEDSATRLRLWDEDWLPATTREALDVLGVDPHASRDTIKSTVTRLRRALHPDYALDEEDRRLRERRLKQINVAWEIVSGRRRSLFLSVKPRTG